MSITDPGLRYFSGKIGMTVSLRIIEGRFHLARDIAPSLYFAIILILCPFSSV